MNAILLIIILVGVFVVLLGAGLRWIHKGTRDLDGAPDMDYGEGQGK